jgi:hypothetical protein
LGCALFAGAVKRKLVRAHLESLGWKRGRKDFFCRLNKNVIDAAAAFTDEVIVAVHERIEMLRTAQFKHLKSLFGGDLLEIPINRSETVLGMSLRTLS